MKINLNKILLATSIFPQFLLIWIVSNYPEKVETYYSLTIYPVLFNVQQVWMEPIPFSVGDIIYIVLVLYILYFLIQFLIKLKLPNKKEFFFFGTFISLVFFVFQLSWGINYHRISLEIKLNIQKQYSDSLLLERTSEFMEMSNYLQNKLSKSDTIAVSIPYSKEKIADIIKDNFSDLSSNKVHVPKVKFSLFSLPISYMGYSGYLNPFTLEAQVNMYIPKINLPVTIAHEMSHQLGYAAENEANFIGFINAYRNEDPYIKYTAALFGFKHCFNDLKKRSPDQAKILIKKLNPGIFKNFAESNAFWSKHKNPLEPYFKKSYDLYLKANGQKSGIETYSDIVALLINFDIKKTNDGYY